jgi:hypothetical protein
VSGSKKEEEGQLVIAVLFIFKKEQHTIIIKISQQRTV